MDLGVGRREPYSVMVNGLMRSMPVTGRVESFRGTGGEPVLGTGGQLVLTLPQTALFVCSVNPFFSAGAKVNSQLRPCWKKNKFSTSGSECLRFLAGNSLPGNPQQIPVENLGVNQGFMLCLLVD